MLVGIDPGFTGAIAKWTSSGIEVHDMPVFKNKTGKTILNLHQLGALLEPGEDIRSQGSPLVAILELVASRPGQGAPATFRFGQSFGATEMALTGLGYEIHYVTPAKWKGYFGLSKDKGVSRSLASQRFPELANQLVRVKDDGRAEAALIALYGAEKVLLYGLDKVL